MNIPRTQALRVRPGERITARKFNGMLDIMDAILRAQPGNGVLVTNLPNQRIYKARSRGGGGGSGSGYPFQATVSAGADEGTMEAVFALGLIAGVEPRISDAPDAKKISDPEAGPFAFKLADAIDPATGRGLLYWQLEFNDDFSVKKIYPAVFKKVPPKTNFKGWKLCGILINPPADVKSTPTWKQMMFHNLNHVASQRAGGKARHTFWSVS